MSAWFREDSHCVTVIVVRGVGAVEVRVHRGSVSTAVVVKDDDRGSAKSSRPSAELCARSLTNSSISSSSLRRRAISAKDGDVLLRKGPILVDVVEDGCESIMVSLPVPSVAAIVSRIRIEDDGEEDSLASFLPVLLAGKD